MEQNTGIPGNLQFHHVGLLVEDIEESARQYGSVFGSGQVGEPIIVSSQQVKVCFIKNGVNSFLELVQPTGEDSVVSKLLKKRVSYYHVAYTVKNIPEAIASFEKLGYRAMEVFSSEAFGGRSCVFLFSPEAHLVELIEE